ncbi:DUF669 domain-containing protein [Psychrobacter pygoscelis]|uniref:DUF669 domain-containing protein n=1 Tax=Psychrobacter pygoscelis TaxID=2488563 RepID=UPI00103EADAD|nr:DUF669 domain-containing protein [Psychrobacter pygoscelis]
MALLNMQFNQTEIAEAQKSDFDPIPAGTYVAEITRSEVKDNNSGSGNRLSLGLKILEGTHAGRLIFQDITLRNTNQVAEQIGRKQMAQLFHACGKLGVQDSSELHGIPMEIKVAIRIDKTGQYDPSNEVKKFAPVAGKPTMQAPTMPQQSQPAQAQMPLTHQAPAAQQANKPVWQRG